MKSFFIRLIVLPAIFISVLSCRKDDDMDLVAVTGGALSASDIELLPTGDEFALSFTSDRPWTMIIQTVPYTDWLVVDKLSGKAGTSVVELSAPINDMRRDREASLTLRANDGSYEKQVLVFQPCPYLNARYGDTGPVVSEISLDYDYYESQGSGTAKDKILVSSNIGWRVDMEDGASSGHFDISPSAGEKDGTVEVLPAGPNFDREPYSCYFDIVPVMEDGSGEETVIPEEITDHYRVFLTQDNFLFMMNGSVYDLSVDVSDMNDRYIMQHLGSDGEADADEPVTEGAESVTVSVEAEGPWHLRTCPEWVETNIISGQSTDLEISVDGVAPTSEDRTGTVSLVAEADSRAVRNINVRQEGYLMEILSDEISGNTVRLENGDLSEHSLQLDTRGPWEILGIPEWLGMSPRSYDGSYTQSGISSHAVTFNALEKNLEFEDKVADITFSRTVKPAGISDDPVDINLEIIQDRFVFDVAPSPVLGEIPFLNTLPYQVEITCSGAWKIESFPEWLNIPVTAGESGTTVIWVNAKTANPYEDRDRSAVIEVVSMDHENAGQDVRRSFEVLQRKYTFEILTDRLDIPAYRTVFPEYSVPLRCSAPWELTAWPEWLSPDVTSGDGMEDVDIGFTPQTNAGSSPRSGLITAKDSYKGREISVQAYQDAFEFDPSPVSFDDIDVMNAASYPVTFRLTAEAPWELVSYPDWTHPSQTSGTSAGNGEATVTFIPGPNPELSERSGTAVVRSTVNGGEKHVDFTQEPYVFDSSPESYDYTELSAEVNSFYVECSGPWTVDAPSWVMFSPSSGSSSRNVDVSVQKNTSLQDREATCRVVSTLNGLQRDIRISQDAFEFDSTPLRYSYDALEDREESFDVICSGRWSARNVPSWVDLSVLSGSGSEEDRAEEVTLNIENNMGLAGRNAIITIASEDNPALMKNITVEQDGFTFTVLPTACRFDAADKGYIAITVECSGDWTASCSEPWVHVSTGTGRFNISVDENGSPSARSATVTVRSTMNGLVTDILVTQDGNPE